MQKGKQRGRNAAGQRAERAGGAGSSPRRGTPPGKKRRGSGGGARSEPGFPSPGAARWSWGRSAARKCHPGARGVPRRGAAPLRPARRQFQGEGVTSGL